MKKKIYTTQNRAVPSQSGATGLATELPQSDLRGRMGWRKATAAFTAFVFAWSMCVSPVMAETINLEGGSVEVNTQENTTNWNVTGNPVWNVPEFNVPQNNIYNISGLSQNASLALLVNGGQASNIFGTMNLSNLAFILQNIAGINIGSSAMINLNNASLLASTLALNTSATDFFARQYSFSGGGGFLTNDGKIVGNNADLVALIANAIENKGTIEVPMGTVALAAGNTVTVGISGDGLVSIGVDEATANKLGLESQIKNTGTISADGGKVILNAQAMDGLFEKAISLEKHGNAVSAVMADNGVIEFQSLDDIYNEALVQARGGEVKIEAAQGGLTNTGMIDAEQGKIEARVLDDIMNEALIKAQEGSIKVESVSGNVTNQGTMMADKGKVEVTAKRDIVNEAIMSSLGGEVRVVSTEGAITNKGTMKADEGVLHLTSKQSAYNKMLMEALHGKVEVESTEGEVVNEGTIRATEGAAALTARQDVTNAGAIEAPKGEIRVTSQEGRVTNLGAMKAQGGNIKLTAEQAAYNKMLLEALNGKIEVTSKKVEIVNEGTMDATGGEMDLTAAGAIKTQGVLKAQTLTEQGATFKVGGRMEVGRAVMENLDHAADIEEGAIISGSYEDVDDINVLGNFSLSGDTTIWADSDGINDLGGIFWSGDYAVAGNNHDLTLKASKDSTIGDVTGVKILTLAGTRSVTPVYTAALATSAWSSITDFRINSDAKLSRFTGTGASGDPYMISDVYGLQAMGGYLAAGTYFELANDIAATSTSGWNAGAGFDPIGDATTKFAGNFDGNSKTISNLKISRGGEDNVGLFGYTNNASIQDVVLSSAGVTGGSNVGAFVGTQEGGTMNRVKLATGTADSEILGTQKVGGLVGVNSGTIQKSSMTGSSWVWAENVLGQVGAGGLVGDNSGAIENSYNASSYGAYANKGRTGGLVGSNSGTILNSYNTGEVMGDMGWPVTGDYIGGLVGENTAGSITNSYSTGHVYDTNTNVGGLVGGLTGGTITNSFYNSQTSGKSDTGKGTPKTTQEMSSAATFTGWDFSVVGDGTIGNWIMADRPRLQQEHTTTLTNAVDLQLIAVDLGASYTLANNIDASGTATWNWVSGTTYGGFSPIAGFSGTFEGNDHTISGLYIYRPSATDVGLFGTSSGQIRNVGLTSGSVTGMVSAGGGGLSSTGALVGNSSGLVDRAYANVSVSGGDSVGGLIGTSSGGSITNSYATGNVTSNGDAGGLISNLYSTTVLQNSYATGDVSAGRIGGGLVAVDQGISINNSYATGDVSGGLRAGGLVGWLLFDASLTNTYASGSVTGGSDIGGLVGLQQAGTANITHSFSKGLVSGGTGNMGGLIGRVADAVVLTQSFYDSETSGQSDTGKGVPKTTTEMMTQATFTGWDFNIDGTGAGSGAWVMAGYPHLQHEWTPTISNASQLQMMALDLDAAYTLAGDIDASGTSGWNAGAGFSPVGYDTSHPFTGSFEGNNHTINGLFMNRGDYTGLFGVWGTGGFEGQGGTLQNVGLTGANISGTSYVGALVGEVLTGVLTNVYSTGSVFGTGSVGGLIGRFGSGAADSTLSNSHSDANVNSTGGSVGGLIGQSWEDVTTSYATGDVSGTIGVGGLIGGRHMGTLSHSYATGDVTASSIMAGGLVGSNVGGFSNSFATGNITGTDRVGGLVGNQNGGDVSDVYAIGSVTGTDKVGGLIGVLAGGSLSQAYSTGSVTADTNKGGLVGYDEYGPVYTSNFWNTTTSGMADGVGNQDPEPAGVTGKTTAEMMQSATFSGWDFTVDGVAAGSGDWIMAGMPHLQIEWSTDIKTLAQLQMMALNLDASYTLANDIDASETSNWNSSAGFSSVGTFTGVLDGGYHEISNLKATQGLFSVLSGGGTIVRNLGLLNVTGTGGSVALTARDSVSITNVYATGTITGGVAGGLVGWLGSAFIDNSYSAVNVTGSGSTGGIAGSLSGASVGQPLPEIRNSYATGSVTNTGSDNWARAGGAVGYTCVGKLINSYATGQVSGGTHAGGLVGYIDFDQMTITNSFWNVETTGQATSAYNHGTGLTIQQMTQQSNFTGWDFDVDGVSAGHNGTWIMAGNPHLQMEWSENITNAAQLQMMALDLDANYTLANNIDASATTTWNWNGSSYLGFDPVGYSTGNWFDPPTNPFTGSLNGAGYGITGLTINRGSENTVGLFGAISGSNISRVGLLGGSVIGADNVGSLVGHAYNSTLSLNYATGTVSGSDQVGGLVGQAGSSSITLSYATGNVTGTGYNTGGLVGDNYQSSIGNSYATGAVSGNAYVGGLVGYNSDSSLTNTFSTGNVSGNSSVGGLIGSYSGGTLTNNYWDTETSGLATSAGEGAGAVEGKTTAQMMQQATFSNWDFRIFQDDRVGIWTMAGLPHLQNEWTDVITNVVQLQMMALDLDANYTLANDIDASGTAGWNGGAGFNPIGEDYGTDFFSGTLDGNNKTITGLTINRPAENYVGLFGAITNSTIQDLGLVNVAVTGSSAVGALAGHNTSSVVSNTYSTGTVTGSSEGSESAAGGLIGKNYGTLTATYSTATVSGNRMVGGLVGEGGSGAYYGRSIIQDSYATGAVTGANNEVGGLSGTLGTAYDGVAEINNSYATGLVISSGYEGGLVGTRYGGTITNSFWNTETSGAAFGVADGIQDGVTGLTTAQMMDPVIYGNAGWDIFTPVWDTYTDALPTLNWQNAAAGTAAYIWSGNSDTDWSTASNWSTGSAPDSNSTVYVFNRANDPLTASSVELQALNILSSGILTLGDTLTVNGALANDGTITGSTVINNGTWSGAGTTNSAVDNFGTVSGGTFNGVYSTDYSDGTITGGTFNGLVNNYGWGTISGGTFHGDVYNDYLISDGTFNGSVTNYTFNAGGGIYGGTFTGGVNNIFTGEISGGTFNCGVTNGGVGSTTAWIFDGTFNGAVFNYEYGTIYGGTFNSSVSNDAGDLSGGIFNGSVTNSALVFDGTFNSVVENAGTIFGGTFTGDLTDWGIVDGGNFGGLQSMTLETGGTWDYDTEVGGSIINKGIIAAGTFTGAVENRLHIAAGTFNGTVINSGAITGGTFALTGDYTQTAGSFSGVTDSMTMANFDLQGGTFQAPDMTVSGAFKVSDGAFTSGSSVITLQGANATYLSTDVNAANTDWMDGTLNIQSDANQALPGDETYGILQLGRNAGTGTTLYTMGSNTSIGTGFTIDLDDAKLVLTVNAMGVNKIYNGTTTATATFTDDHITGYYEAYTINYTASFADKNVGTGKAINVTGISLSGASASYYQLAFSSDATTADITAKAITLSGITASNKVYDQTTAVTVSTTGADFAGMIDGDELTVSSTGVFSDKNVAAGKTVTLTNTLGGADLANYSITDQGTTTADITAKAVTLSGITASNKIYDATTDATVSTVGATFTGMIGGDELTVSSTGVFSDKNVASGKTVTLTNTLGGADLANYTITDQGTTTANITAKAVTLSGITASNKVYDQTTDATVSTAGAVFTGMVDGDDLTVSSTGTFSDKNVAVGKTVTLTNTFDGADLGNYTITDQGTTTADITKAAVTLSGITASNKVYDQTTDATVSTAGAVFSGMYAGDELTVLSTGAFSDKNAADGKTVTLTNTFGGADLANYEITDQGSILANITKAVATLSGITASNKVYDSTTAATVNDTGAIFGGLYSGDELTVSSTGVFSDKNAGDGKTVNLSNILGGVDLGNYTVIDQTTTTADITKAAVTLSGITASNKVYDQTTAATVSTSGALFAGKYDGDVLTVSSTGTFSDKNVANGKTVTLANTFGGTDLGNYNITDQGTTTADITKATVTLSGITASNKVYDQTIAATVSTAGADFAGKYVGDVLTVSSTGTFSDKNVGTGKTVTLANSFGGADLGNYNITDQGTTTADITKATVTLSGITASNKVYDQTTAATVSTVGAAFAGKYAGDVLTVSSTGTFGDKNVANGKTVTLVNTFGGTDLGNYNIADQGTTTANITQKAVTLGGITASSKVYDTTTDVNVSSAGANFSGLIAGDELTVSSAGVFSDKNAGIAKQVDLTNVLGGADLNNYMVIDQQTTTADITKATVTLSGITASNKIYDSTTAATVSTSGAAFAGKYAGDELTVSSAGTFSDKNVGVGKTVTLANTISGADAGNYTVVDQGTTVADITKASVTLSGITASDKFYDGTTDAAISTAGAIFEGKYAGDTLTVSSTGVFDDKNVGTEKIVTLTNILGGSDLENYQIADQATTTADIQARGVAIDLTGSRVYDGTVNLAAEIFTLSNLVGGETLTLTGVGTMADKHVADGKTVTLGTLALGDGMNGGLASNYTLTGGTHTVDIIAAPIMISAENISKTYDGGLAAPTTARVYSGQLFDTDTILGGTFAFTDKNVGYANKTITVSDVTVSDGNGGGNYAITYVDNTTSTINPYVVDLSGSRVYDGTLEVAAGVFSLSALVGTETLTLTGIGRMDDKNVGIHKAVTTGTLALGDGMNGGLAGNYTLEGGTHTVNIGKATAALSGVAALNKVYDATTAAAVSTAGAAFAGKYGNDVLTVSSTGTFSDKNVAAGKTVTLVNTFGGSDLGNYNITDQATTTADITKATVTLSGITASNKVYDQTTVATTNTAGAAFAGKYAGDVLTVSSTGTFGDKNVGTGKTITLVNTFGGADLGNYNITDQGTTTADITKASVTLSGITASNKVYDQTTAATVSTAGAAFAGKYDGDVLTVSSTGVFSDKNVANGKTVTLTNTFGGTDLGNYQITDQGMTTASITARPLTITATGIHKVYDGTTAAAATLSDNRLTGDVLAPSYTTATYADSLVGTSKPVTVSGISLSGVDSYNYAYNAVATTLADITPVPVVIVTPPTVVDPPPIVIPPQPPVITPPPVVIVEPPAITNPPINITPPTPPTPPVTPPTTPVTPPTQPVTPPAQPSVPAAGSTPSSGTVSSQPATTPAAGNTASSGTTGTSAASQENSSSSSTANSSSSSAGRQGDNDSGQASEGEDSREQGAIAKDEAAAENDGVAPSKEEAANIQWRDVPIDVMMKNQDNRKFLTDVRVLEGAVYVIDAVNTMSLLGMGDSMRVLYKKRVSKAIKAPKKVDIQERQKSREEIAEAKDLVVETIPQEAPKEPATPEMKEALTQILEKVKEEPEVEPAPANRVLKSASPVIMHQTKTGERYGTLKNPGRDVFVRSNGGDWKAAADGMIILPGDEVKTADRNSVEVLMDDGKTGRVEIKEGSLFRIQKAETDSVTGAKTTLLDLAMGKILVKVESLKGNSRFEVRTPTALTGVRGTTFEVTVKEKA